MTSSSTDIAVIGISCRVPKADNVEQFWHNLKNGVNSVTTITKEELKESNVSDALLNHPRYVRVASLLSDIENFDADFFELSALDTLFMDPQHRLFLECAWEVFEDAGYNVEDCGARVGVFGGEDTLSLFSYFLSNIYSRSYNDSSRNLTNRMRAKHGNSVDYLCQRVSYKLNLKGPCLGIQSACSTSLMTTHLACQSLLTYQCDMAISGGVTIQVPQKIGYLYEEGGIFSKDGACHVFDVQSSGTIFGNGVGVVLLKRLQDAVDDNDHIYAVIKGSAINHDGALRVGFTAPSVQGQTEVISEALAVAQVDPSTIGYIEAHGTGTVLGDPIEVASLTNAFRGYTDRKEFCALGAVKANMGHLNAAAGIVSLIKTILTLYHRTVPPMINYTRPNEQIDFKNSPFFINTDVLPLDKSIGYPLRAGVSSFGMGGANAHVVLEEYLVIKSETKEAKQEYELLVFSARSEKALEENIAKFKKYLSTSKDLLSDIAYTLKIGRKAFEHRRFFICKEIKDFGSEPQAGQKTDLYVELQKMGETWLRGDKIDWRAYYQGRRCKRIPLPTYSFERKHYWMKAPKREDGVFPGKVAKDQGGERPQLSSDYLEPSNYIEKTCVNIFRELLDVDRIGIKDDFFELGGQSLLATQIITRITECFPVVISFTDLNKAPTIEKLALVIEGKIRETLANMSEEEAEKILDLLE